MQRRIFSGVPAVVNVLRPQGSYAIIGPGGGVDVLRALAGGSRNITGIEINPVIVNTIMLDKYRDYSQRLYEQPEVHIHVSDGRSFLRSSPDRYDVVQMTLVDTWAATSAGVFALSENNLYTVEAFREYFEHLKPDGMLAVTRWEFRQPREALRVVSQGMAVLRTLGVERADAHFLIVANSPLDEDGVPVTVLIKRSPFTAEEEAALQAHLREHTHLRVIYTPSTQESNPFTRLIQSGDPRRFAQDYAYNVAPVTDNNPFFFFTVKAEDVIAGALGGDGRGIDWRINLGVAVLVMLLGISLGAVALFLILPLAVRTGVRGHNMLRLFYFVAVGLGYILVEIALIQRFVLFLGHPTYALTVVVFLMLLASGAGSVTARRWLAQPVRVRIVLAGIVLVVAAYVYLLPPLLARLVGLPFLAKLLLCGVLLLPLGFIMGMPFPTGLRALAGGGEETIEWAFALNAAASVLGSTLAVVIAIQWGLGATLATGAAAYALAATATSLWRRAEG
jgi:spermidine synthase